MPPRKSTKKTPREEQGDSRDGDGKIDVPDDRAPARPPDALRGPTPQAGAAGGAALRRRAMRRWLSDDYQAWLSARFGKDATPTASALSAEECPPQRAMVFPPMAVATVALSSVLLAREPPSAGVLSDDPATASRVHTFDALGDTNDATKLCAVCWRPARYRCPRCANASWLPGVARPPPQGGGTSRFGRTLTSTLSSTHFDTDEPSADAEGPIHRMPSSLSAHDGHWLLLQPAPPTGSVAVSAGGDRTPHHHTTPIPADHCIGGEAVCWADVDAADTAAVLLGDVAAADTAAVLLGDVAAADTAAVLLGDVADGVPQRSSVCNNDGGARGSLGNDLHRRAATRSDGSVRFASHCWQLHRGGALHVVAARKAAACDVEARQSVQRLQSYFCSARCGLVHLETRCGKHVV